MLQKLNLSNLHNDEQGLSTVEYIILLVLIAVVSMGLWMTFGEKVQTAVTDSTAEFDGTVGTKT